MDDLYIIVKETAMYGVAIAAIASGYKIYVKWNRGEPVIPLIFAWVLSLIIATGLFQMVYSLILMGDVHNYSPVGSAMTFAKEMHSASIVVGILVAIIAVIHIYYKYNSGDDVTELVYRWVGSLFFLFTFGMIIELLL